MERLQLGPDDHVLAVVAHPDDMEYGSSAAVAKWTGDGVTVSYLLLTGGEHGIAGASPSDTARVRAAEQREACARVGVDNLTILDFPDGLLSYSLELREAICAHIRRLRPTVILTQNWAEVAPWGLNQADHRVAGLAAVDAARDAGNEFLFPAAGPKHQARLLLVGGHADPDVAVVMEEHHVSAGEASLAAHEQYLAALPEHPAPAEIVGGAARAGGEAAGCEHAIAFKAYDL